MEFYSRRLLDLLQPARLTLVNTPTAVAAGGDMLPASVQPLRNPSNLRVMVVFAGAVPGMKLRAHTSTRTLDAAVLTNVGTLDADTWHIFDVPVSRDFSYNLNPTDATTLLYAEVLEVGSTIVG